MDDVWKPPHMEKHGVGICFRGWWCQLSGRKIHQFKTFWDVRVEIYQWKVVFVDSFPSLPAPGNSSSLLQKGNHLLRFVLMRKNTMSSSKRVPQIQKWRSKSRQSRRKFKLRTNMFQIQILKFQKWGTRVLQNHFFGENWGYICALPLVCPMYRNVTDCCGHCVVLDLNPL